MNSETVTEMSTAVQPNEHDRFLLRQRIRPVVNQYEFSLPAENGTPGEPFCFVEQKRFKFKEDIRFYSDDSKTHELLRRLGRKEEARAAYERALELAHDDAERRLLERRLADLR